MVRINDLNLYMTLIGFKPKGFRTEQHDIVFHLGTSIEDPMGHKMIRSKIPIDPKLKVHIDATMMIDHIDGHDIFIWPKKMLKEIRGPKRKKLWFVNLGGYKLDDFTEHHKRLLFLREKESEAIEAALKDPFVDAMDKPHKQALPHRDDSHAVDGDLLAADAEDVLSVGDEFEDYVLLFEPNSAGIDSLSKKPQITGYMKIEV
ncbi:MAG: hypothetical protein JWM20_754 [Patescibacteria group bacterium]|nr:hypothetical protein [Patescibacteria group bacterium]